MLDITQLTPNPIPLPVSELNLLNENLMKDNKELKQVIVGLIIAGCIIGVYYHLKKRNKNETREES